MTAQIVVNLSPEDKSLLRNLARELEMTLAAVARRIGGNRGGPAMMQPAQGGPVPATN